MAGVRRVAPENLAFQRAGRGRTLTVVPPADRKVPTAPRGIGKLARAIWRDFWQSPVSAAVDLGADQYAVKRWILAVDERERLLEEVTPERLVRGSMGQEILNPLYRRIDVLTKEIERAEERFGMTPQSRFRLQINIGEAGEAREKLDRIARRREEDGETMPEAAAVEVLDLDALG